MSRLYNVSLRRCCYRIGDGSWRVRRGELARTWMNLEMARPLLAKSGGGRQRQMAKHMFAVTCAGKCGEPRSASGQKLPPPHLLGRLL